MSESAHIRLLLVDDETEFLEATSRALKRRGFEVDTAVNGRVALGLVAERNYDVFILDVKMPGIDGIDLFYRLRVMRPETPVLMLTGHGNVQQAFETSRDGVFDYLTKPCDVERLAEVARRVVAVANESIDPESAAPEGEEIRLLLVDDEADFVDAMARALARRGLRVTTALSPAEALELVDQQIFDVAVIDVRMPGMDGLELLRRLRAAQPLLEVLLLTGHPTMSIAVEAVREGAFDFLTKPQEVDALAVAIGKAYRLRALREEMRRKAQVKEIIERNPS